MRILHFHPSMAGGGIEAMICGLANEMCCQGHDVTIGTIFKPKDTDIFWNKLSPKVEKFSLGKVKEGFSIKELFAIYKAIKNGGYDVVNVHGFLYYYLIPIILLHKRTKFFYTVHSDASRESAPWDRRILWIKRFLFKYGWIKAVTISDASDKSFTEFYGCRARWINNGVSKKEITKERNDIDKYRFSINTKVFLHPGRICKAKNQIVLCKVFCKLISEGYDIVLLFAGNNEDKHIYNELKPYFSERIVYLGERRDVVDLLARADGFCLSSIWEGMPVTLLEALSVGCIPICTPVGGIVNVINNGYNGFLSKGMDEVSYHEALLAYLKMDDVDLRQVKRNCLNSFEPYDIRMCAKRYIEYYKE